MSHHSPHRTPAQPSPCTTAPILIPAPCQFSTIYHPILYIPCHPIPYPSHPLHTTAPHQATSGPDGNSPSASSSTKSASSAGASSIAHPTSPHPRPCPICIPSHEPQSTSHPPSPAAPPSHQSHPYSPTHPIPSSPAIPSSLAIRTAPPPIPSIPCNEPPSTCGDVCFCCSCPHDYICRHLG